MKTTIAVYALKNWGPYKTEDGREISGISAIWSFEDHETIKTTLKGDLLALVQSSKLPALFEAEVKPVQKYNKGKATLAYEINSLKFLKEVQIFSKA